MILKREDILRARPAASAVEVPEWGGTVHLRPLSVAALMGFLEAKDQLPPLELFPTLLTLSLCDEAGSLLFDGDLDSLKHADYGTLERLGKLALVLNRLAPGDDEAVAKNS